MKNTNPKLRIAILGTGAVGGYFGGLLAGKYSGSDEAEIIFITRPATEKVIREKGLKIISDKEERIVFPDLVTSEPHKIGRLDLLICCIKSYDLEDSLKPLSGSISANTLILPLLNGVDAGERIKKLFPQNEVLEGCVYIVTRLIEPGVVKETGNTRSLFFGSTKGITENLKKIEAVFKDAGIDASLSGNIRQVVWEKFLFISTLASLTSYLDKPAGAIMADESYRNMLIRLLEELIAVAKAINIHFPENIIESRIATMEKLPYETTSSMHSDFQKGGRTEYLSLTKYVVDLGKKLNIQTPLYEKVLSGLILKTK
ncbi:MAG TPA: 2-dehydropantoate 2-reductase [Bacteroidia bacterium]|jgi:2-dehydropantoate 2-reductase